LILSIDLETRSPADLKKAGAYRYFEHPYTEILCACWAIDDGPVHQWFPSDGIPEELAWAVVSRETQISGWNVNFERQGWNRILGPIHGWPVPRLEQYRDTAAQSAAQSLPRSLEKAAAALAMPERKDLAGHKLMMSMARPRKRRTGEAYQTHYWNEGDLNRLADYCAQDVIVERAIRDKLRPLSPEEFELWRFDQLINDRGITLDLELVDDMLAVVEKHMETVNAQMADITGGAVTACTQTPSLKVWMAEQGFVATSLAKGVIGDVMAREKLPKVQRALDLWQEASRASVNKLKAAKTCVGGDGRARGLLLFHGANTGRWSGQLLQPQNLPRGSGTTGTIDVAIDMVRYRDPALLTFMYDSPLTVISDCLRGIMCAAPGRQLIAGDFTSVEARITAWLAGASEKIDQFIRQDRGDGPEVYKLAASRIYGVPVERVSKEQRQTGKTAELALGFGGGVDALAKMALNYHIDMSLAWEPLWAAASPEERELADERFADVFAKGNNDWLSRKAWQACHLTVRAWRRANAPIVEMWDQFHSASWHTLDSPKKEFTAGRVTFVREGGFLWLTLPSGRRLAYPTPMKENREVPWSDKRLPVPLREHKDVLTVLAFEQGHAHRPSFYPGILFQHSVQAIARDLLAHGMNNVEAAGYPVVMSIHDEVICEIHQGDYAGNFLDLLCAMPDWAKGIPLLAEGWVGHRYRK